MSGDKQNKKRYGISDAGYRIQGLRKDRGLTTDELGNAIGASAANIKKWESGARNIDGQHLIALSKFFGVSADYIIGLTNVESPNPEVKAICDYTGLSEDAVNVLHYIRSKSDSPEDDAAVVNRYNVSFINRILGMCAKYASDDEEGDTRFIETVFSLMERYITIKSTQTGIRYHAGNDFGKADGLSIDLGVESEILKSHEVASLLLKTRIDKALDRLAEKENEK